MAKEKQTTPAAAPAEKPVARAHHRRARGKNPQAPAKKPETARAPLASAPAKKQPQKPSQKPVPRDNKTPLPRDGATAKTRARAERTAKGHGSIRVAMLGGLQEIGKNLAVIEYENDILLVDCGLAFPDDEMLGVDLVIPDISYLEKNAERIRGLVLTHGHEDHIGGVPYLLRTINPPIYSTRLTLGILENKLTEHRLPHKPRLHTVSAGDTVKLGAFSVEFIHVNHSIADACALAIRTPAGTIVHTGDFKLDVSPIDGNMMDISRLGEIGREGVTLLMCESTNAERPGFTPSERKVGASLERIFAAHPDKRIIVATFSSNVHRVQQIVDASARHNRKVAVLGRSMLNVVGAAVELGYMQFPAGTLIDISEIRRYRPDQVTIITTGSQGEPMSALYRMAFSEHDKVTLCDSDVVVLSSSAIPGNEKLVGKIINALCRIGVTIINDAVADVHVSGHACQEELKLMMALTRPKYFMPIHGEDRHLCANRELALFMGIPASHIFVPEIGRVLEIGARGAAFQKTPIPSGNVLVDGSGVGDVGSIVLRDRRHLSQDGLIVAVATVDMTERLLLSGPDIVSRGFVYVRESEELIDAARKLAQSTIEDALADDGADWMQIKKAVRDNLSKFFYAKTERSPMILPVIMSM